MPISPTIAFFVAILLVLASLSPRMAFFIAGMVMVLVGLFSIQAQLGYW